jgi:Xaa-Pro aminopeptidase
MVRPSDEAIGRAAEAILHDFGMCFAEAAGDRDRTFWLSAYAPERDAVRGAFEALAETEQVESE